MLYNSLRIAFFQTIPSTETISQTARFQKTYTTPPDSHVGAWAKLGHIHFNTPIWSSEIILLRRTSIDPEIFLRCNLTSNNLLWLLTTSCGCAVYCFILLWWKIIYPYAFPPTWLNICHFLGKPINQTAIVKSASMKLLPSLKLT